MRKPCLSHWQNQEYVLLAKQGRPPSAIVRAIETSGFFAGFKVWFTAGHQWSIQCLFVFWLVVWKFFVFPYIVNNHPNSLTIFRGVETTSQTCSARETPSLHLFFCRIWPICVCGCVFSHTGMFLGYTCNRL